jgi:hypothetical protein
MQNEKKYCIRQSNTFQLVQNIIKVEQLYAESVNCMQRQEYYLVKKKAYFEILKMRRVLQ